MVLIAPAARPESAIPTPYPEVVCGGSTRSDRNPERSMIRVTGNVPAGMQEEGTTKGGRSRVVPLVDLAIEAVEPLSQRERFTGLDDLVFPAPDSDFCTPDPMRRSLYRALDAAGYGHLRQKRLGRLPFRWHDLRHCFGTLAAQAFSLRDAQAFMDHEHISTTEIYLH
ncbi:MAG: site-specific integrase, partial [Actinomycetota bacterium]|nr:site-specific integrase [Actinomycetota bacterium]